MSISTNKKTIALAASAVLTAGLALSPTIASADTSSPFAAAELSNGYMQLAEGKCGEGKCGEGKCGGASHEESGKTAEGKCGEGKCGEGKCGTEAHPEKAEEGKCGEGKCGEGKCGAAK